MFLKYVHRLRFPPLSHGCNCDPAGCYPGANARCGLLEPSCSPRGMRRLLSSRPGARFVEVFRRVQTRIKTSAATSVITRKKQQGSSLNDVLLHTLIIPTFTNATTAAGCTIPDYYWSCLHAATADPRPDSPLKSLLDELTDMLALFLELTTVFNMTSRISLSAISVDGLGFDTTMPRHCQFWTQACPV